MIHRHTCITSWKVDGEKMEAVADFTFLGSNITVDDDCSHKIKKHLLRGRKGLSVIKSRDTTLMTKVHIVKAMLFHVWM